MPHPSACYTKEKNTLIQQGYYTTDMLFGYVNAMRRLVDLKPYTSIISLQQTLRRHNIQPRAVCHGTSRRYRNWWKLDEVAPLLLNIRERDQKAFLSKDATEDELNSGDWQDVITTSRVTGIRKARLTSLGSHNLHATRVHPYTQERLYHVPSMREIGYYRDTNYLYKLFGVDQANALIATRPIKTIKSDFCNKRMIYCPELAHL